MVSIDWKFSYSRGGGKSPLVYTMAATGYTVLSFGAASTLKFSINHIYSGRSSRLLHGMSNCYQKIDSYLLHMYIELGQGAMPSACS